MGGGPNTPPLPDSDSNDELLITLPVPPIPAEITRLQRRAPGLKVRWIQVLDRGVEGQEAEGSVRGEFYFFVFWSLGTGRVGGLEWRDDGAWKARRQGREGRRGRVLVFTVVALLVGSRTGEIGPPETARLDQTIKFKGLLE